MCHKVKCILGGEPNIRSNVNGSKLAIELPATNNKQYDFLYDGSKLELVPGDLVVCQVRNSFTFGVVQSVSRFETTHEDYLHNVVLEEGSHKLIVSKIDWSAVKLAIRAKRLYAREKREQEKRAKLNTEAFNATLEVL